ncbi:hypothetical protein [Microbacterium schleiferi]|uniref:hypothetical protein n=1 Tax=Microbacterium schleiferi TaxID=69362 RepID=UPI001D179754|nr:hypothetical protein [Microbacterium schleiferi]MCC4268026.1 hypothetical protein [Microbacterium schleiferi]
MPTNPVPLNPPQLEILSWIQNGCPVGTYDEGFQHRVSARALERRGLVRVRGHGASWSAAITEKGTYYLEHGDYAPDASTLLRVAPPNTKPVTVSPVKKVSKPRPKAPPRIGPTDAMMIALAEANDHRMAIETEQLQRYTQLAKTAERFKKIPEGMQVVVTHNWRARTAEVALLPLPEWRTRILDPIAIPTTLRGASDAITTIGARDDLNIRSSEKNRALRLLRALADEAQCRGYLVKAVPLPRKDRWGFASRDEEHVGFLNIALLPDEYRLTIHQISEQVEHVATKTELARAGRGYAVPKWDRVPTQRLGIRIDTRGRSFWGSEWVDKSTRPLDVALAQILQELELRHEAAEADRAEEERRRLQRRREWEHARELAIQALTNEVRAEAVSSRIARWEEAARIRAYIAHVETHTVPLLSETDLADTREWLAWAESYAEKLDPAGEKLRLPDPPDPTPTALQPFMGSLSPYGPERY